MCEDVGKERVGMKVQETLWLSDLNSTGCHLGNLDF